MAPYHYREANVSVRFDRALARLDYRMEQQARLPGADAPSFVQLYSRFDTWAGVLETRAITRSNATLAGRALRTLHALQVRHAQFVAAPRTDTDIANDPRS